MNTGTPINLPRGIRFLNDPRRKMNFVYDRTIDGRRVRTFFSTLDAAIRGKAAAEAAMKTGADGRRIFDAAAQREYEAAKKIVATEGNMSLIDVAIFYREHAELRASQRKTVAEVATEIKGYIAMRNLSESFQKLSNVYLTQFSTAFGNRNIATIKGREVVEWLLSLNLSARSIISVRGVLAYFFRRARSMDYLKIVPEIDRTLLPKIPPSPVQTVSTEEAFKILSAATGTKYLANVALRLFCGLRAAEAARMQWEWIDEERKRIVIPAKICKTRDDWVLQCPLLPETIFRWLAVVPASEKHGSVPAPSHHEETMLFKRAGMQWRRNAMRHTFCTMHVSLFDSADKTALLLKHKGTAMLYKHYLAKLVPREEAEAYFALSPCKNRGKDNAFLFNGNGKAETEEEKLA